MRVLWFCNTSVNAYIDASELSYSGGWLNSLETIVNKNQQIELGVIFDSKKDVSIIKKGNTTYFPIYNKQHKYLKFSLAEKAINVLRKNSVLSDYKKKQIEAIVNVFKTRYCSFSWY